MQVIKSNVIQTKQHENILVKEYETDYASLSNLRQPKEIVQLLNDVFSLNVMAEEYVYLLAMTTSGELISLFEVSHGTVNMSLVRGREVMIRALLCGAASIILVHNHPSGDIRPSKADIEQTIEIKEVCHLIGIDFLDHIIIGGGDYYSFKEEQKDI